MTSVLLYMPQSNMRPGFLDFWGSMQHTPTIASYDFWTTPMWIPPKKKKLHKAVSENQNQTLPILIIYHWLVVWTPLKNISQLGWLFPIYGKIKHLPNHQPDYFPIFFRYFPHLLKAPRSEPPLFFRCRRRSAQRGSRSRRASGPERPQASWARHELLWMGEMGEKVY